MYSDRPDYSIIDHTADVGITVRGTDIKNLFKEAAKSITHLMVRANPAKETGTVKLSVEGCDSADLMVRWLGEILYLLEGENKVVTHIGIDSISPSHLDATLKTVPFDPNTDEILYEIKAVTYHQIEVAEKGDHWEARIIFDL
ncbi:MAG: archease [Deltaproteobacteria bacterium]|nr:archease [Deltaproteobacteria bacterium]